MNKERSDRTIAPLFISWYAGYGPGVKQCLLKCVIGGRTTTYTAYLCLLSLPSTLV